MKITFLLKSDRSPLLPCHAIVTYSLTSIIQKSIKPRAACFPRAAIAPLEELGEHEKDNLSNSLIIHDENPKELNYI